MESTHVFLIGQIIFGSFAFYHFAVGIPSALSVGMIRKIAARVYSLKLPENLDPRYEYQIKPLGFYAITLAILCCLEVTSTDSFHRAVFLLALAGLLILRAWGRLFYRDLFFRAFGTTWQRSLWNVIFNIVLAVVCIGTAVQSYFAII